MASLITSTMPVAFVFRPKRCRPRRPDACSNDHNGTDNHVTRVENGTTTHDGTDPGQDKCDEQNWACRLADILYTRVIGSSAASPSIRLMYSNRLLNDSLIGPGRPSGQGHPASWAGEPYLRCRRRRQAGTCRPGVAPSSVSLRHTAAWTATGGKPLAIAMAGRQDSGP